MTIRRKAQPGVWLIAAVVLAVGCGETESSEAPPPEPEVAEVMAVPEADPADVASVEAITAAVYEVISGPAGTPRDWDRWHSLFLPNARLYPVGANQDGRWVANGMSPEDFVTLADESFTENGFYEIEIGNVTEVYGNIAHRFSSYASYRTEEDPEPFNRGINSIQLLNDGERWWVLTIFWQHEPDAGPIPARYLDSPYD